MTEKTKSNLIELLKNKNISAVKNEINSMLNKKALEEINHIRNEVINECDDEEDVKDFFQFIGATEYYEDDFEITAVFNTKSALQYAIDQMPDDLDFDVFYYPDGVDYDDDGTEYDDSVEVEVEEMEDTLEDARYEIVITKDDDFYDDDDDDDDDDWQEKEDLDEGVMDLVSALVDPRKMYTFDFKPNIDRPKRRELLRRMASVKVIQAIGGKFTEKQADEMRKLLKKHKLAHHVDLVDTGIKESAILENTFTKAQIKQLQKEYGSIERVDPNGETIKKMKNTIKKMTPMMRDQLKTANIKWLSYLARQVDESNDNDFEFIDPAYFIDEANKTEGGRLIKKRVSYAKQRRGGKLINRRQKRRQGKVSKGVGKGYKTKGAGWKAKLLKSNRKRKITRRKNVKAQRIGKRLAKKSRNLRRKMGVK